MERELQHRKQHKRAILVLAIILAVVVVANIFLWLIALNNDNGIKSVGTLNLETHFFYTSSPVATNMNFPKDEFVSEGKFERLLVINNKTKDCYLRFWLVSKIGENVNSLTEVNNIMTLTAHNSYNENQSQPVHPNSVVKNERYLVSSDNKIYYTTDNEGKESVFQKNTTASIKLIFQVADLSDEYYKNKKYKFEIMIEAVDVNEQSISSWVLPADWPKA